MLRCTARFREKTGWHAALSTSGSRSSDNIYTLWVDGYFTQLRVFMATSSFRRRLLCVMITAFILVFGTVFVAGDKQQCQGNSLCDDSFQLGSMCCHKTRDCRKVPCGIKSRLLRCRSSTFYGIRHLCACDQHCGLYGDCCPGVENCHFKSKPAPQDTWEVSVCVCVDEVPFSLLIVWFTVHTVTAMYKHGIVDHLSICLARTFHHNSLYLYGAYQK